MSLLLLTALLQLCFSVSAAQRRVVTRLTERSDVLEAGRTVWWVLSSETAAGLPGRDWSVDVPDVLSLRAFRGWGPVCSTGLDPDGWVEVRFHGWRVPDPDKDSVLTLDVGGRWTARRLASRAAGAESCAPGASGRPERWRLDPPPQARVVLGRVFERGSYHVEDPSFRYRRGAGGRQPLTAAVLDPDGSGLSAGPGLPLEVRFRGSGWLGSGGGSSGDPGWTRPLRGG